jgi:hypothetical protein
VVELPLRDVLDGRDAREKLLKKANVLGKVEMAFRKKRKQQKKDMEEAALIETSRIQAGMSREQAMLFLDLIQLDEGMEAMAYRVI